MSNEKNKDIDTLLDAFRKQDATKPSVDARDSAIQSAMSAFETEFDEKESTADQGITNGTRLNSQGNTNPKLFNWRRLMTFELPKFSHMLAGGASLAAIALVVNMNLQQSTGTLSDPLNPGALIDELGETKAKRERADLDDKTVKSDKSNVGKDVAAQIATTPEPSVKPAQEVLSLEAKPKSSVRNERKRIVPKLMAKPTLKQDFASGLSKNVARSQPSDGAQISQLSVQDSSITPERPTPGYKEQGRDKFSDIEPNPVKLAAEDPVSTFSVDVDTASYSFMRSSLNNGVLPQKDAVRVEELINYFDYGYRAPDSRETPFSSGVAIMPSPWNDNTKLMRIGIKGYELPKENQPPANLVFLIDTSGSMNAPNKLPLLRNSFKLLLSSLKPTDTISIVTYAGSAGTALEPTQVSDKNKILAALDNLRSGGSTAGAEGIRQAYQLAEQSKVDGVNRVILATDGDFNVGIRDPRELKSFVENKRKSGVTLSVLGFGRGNYNDELMQTLAQNGNGNAAYIDTLSEARKVLVEQAGSTLFTIAKDVKLQVEFNPNLVSEYRLIGYETRKLNREDFNNDKVDAGDIGAGHTVTALYEFRPAGSSGTVDSLRYSTAKKEDATKTQTEFRSEYAFMKIRYKAPGGDTSKLISTPVTTNSEYSSVEAAPQNMRFAAAVAAYGQVLRGGRYTEQFKYDEIIELALSAKGADPFGYRSEFVNLVRLAKTAAAMAPLKQ